MEEEEFWQNELQIEQDSERQLRQQLAELQGRVRDCEARLSEYLVRVQVRLTSQKGCRTSHFYRVFKQYHLWFVFCKVQPQY